jgi:hypothetical protein
MLLTTAEIVETLHELVVPPAKCQSFRVARFLGSRFNVRVPRFEVLRFEVLRFEVPRFEVPRFEVPRFEVSGFLVPRFDRAVRRFGE